ncbi:3896_t:CDS:1 [Diversispora eburnea]|uniref:3896_t:CDS:1 n=1 Tax=Diversispora eburnea TaxID=1213867 RepID=A0A9N9C5F8_9GLOM|nr:3896_t:CDS:1 [Diversispora eburnea]
MKIIRQINISFNVFENAIQNFSGDTYVTLSTIISIIKKLIFDLTCDSSLDNINYLNENTIFETEPFTNKLLIKIKDEKIISNISKRSIFIKNSLDTTGIFEKVKNNIYSALIYYWNFFNDIELITSLLDSHYKILDFIESEDKKKRIIQKLHNELNPNNLLSTESSNSTTLLTNNIEFLLYSLRNIVNIIK